MSYSSNAIRLLGTRLALVLALAISGIAQPSEQPPHAPTQGAANAAPSPKDVRSCASKSSTPTAARPPSQANPSAHSVTLSWKASLPGSSSPRDAVRGYYVYRSLKSNRYNDTNRINSKPLSGSQCVDTTVEHRKTYFYVVMAVSVSGMKSVLSNQATARIPRR
jgi:hypothetical protein